MKKLLASLALLSLACFAPAFGQSEGGGFGGGGGPGGGGPLPPGLGYGSAVIPLQKFQLPGGGYKFGIRVGIGGAPPRMYIFDTGSTNFVSGWEPGVQWWGRYTNLGKYGRGGYKSGLEYKYAESNTIVSLGYGIYGKATIGRITSAAGGTVGTAAQWKEKLEHNQPPIENLFFGIFGADLTGQTGGLFSVLPQLRGNLSSGFVIRTGGRNTKYPATLTVGLTPALRAQFPIVLPLNGPNPGSPTHFPNSNRLASSLSAIAANVTLNDGTHTQSFPINLILDTGAPSMTIYQKKGKLEVDDVFKHDGALKPGVMVTFQLAGLDFSNGAPGLTWKVIATAPGGGTAVGLAKATGKDGSINVGLDIYFDYNVMFDVAYGVLRLQPLPPSQL
jgi:hypothetical protein